MNLQKVNNQNNKEIKDIYLFKPNINEDSRGFFFESWNQENFNLLVQREINFVQDNQSLSEFMVLRGLHFQLPPKAQGKLIRVINGEILDIFVDLRKNSETFKTWGSVYLSSQNKNQLWIPEGFAHGFLALKKNTEVLYKVNNYWDKKLERTLKWNDIELNINWPINLKNQDQIFISEKDQRGSTLKDLILKGEIF